MTTGPSCVAALSTFSALGAFAQSTRPTGQDSTKTNDMAKDSMSMDGMKDGSMKKDGMSK